MLGVILSAGNAQGLILGNDGVRYTFTPLGWKSEDVRPQMGLRVSFEARGSVAEEIYAIQGQAQPTAPTPYQLAQPATTIPTPPSSGQEPGSSATPRQPDPRSKTALASPGGFIRKLGAPASWLSSTKWWHWAIAAGIALLIAVGILVAVLLQGPPIGREIARVLYSGASYTLVEYGNDLAIFDRNGSPVTGEQTAAVLSNYAWQQELRSIDRDELAGSARNAESVNDSLSGARNFTNDVIDLLDGLDSLSVSLLGSRISALDVLAESFDGLREAESLMRAFSSELNDLESAGDDLSDAARRMTEIDAAQASAGEIRSLFEDVLHAAENIPPAASSVRERLSEVEEAAIGLEEGLLKSSDVPVIGDALRDYAETVSGLHLRLSRISGLLENLETDLASLSRGFQASMDSATKALEDYMNRWLEEPHDPEWPPADPDRRPEGSTSAPDVAPKAAPSPLAPAQAS